MPDTPMMSLEELRLRLSMGRGHKARGSVYIVSPETHKRMGDALEFYASLGIEVEPKPFKCDP